MDRGLVSLVSNNNNNNKLSPMSGALLMSPPTFSRLPPDGHEFPPNFAEPHLQTMMMTGQQQQPQQTSKVVEATMKIR